MIISVIRDKDTDVFQESLTDETTSTFPDCSAEAVAHCNFEALSFQDMARLGRWRERKGACGAVGYMAVSIVANSPLEDLLWLET